RVPSVLRDAACRDVGLRGGLRPGGRGPAAGAVPCPSGLDGRCAGSGARRSVADALRPALPGAVLRARLRHDRPPPVRSAAARAPLRVLRDARPGRAVAVARGDRVTTSLADGPFTLVDDALPNLEQAVSPLVGIVTQTLYTTSTTDEARLPNCASELASARRTLGLATVDFGAGAHPEPARARAAAIGEALERYSALFVPEERVRTPRPAALGAAAVRPARFALFHPTQLADPRFPFVEFDEETPVPFVPGISLDDGSAAFLPAEIVYLGRPGTATRPIAYSTSSGLACAPTFTEAVLAALLDEGEREPSCSPGDAASRGRSSTGAKTTSSGRTTGGTSGSPGSRSACSTGAASSACRSRSQSCTDSRRRERRLRSAQGPQPPSPRPG